MFWERWRKEFLQTRQLRKKWVKAQRNMLVGDIVVIKDENAPRNMWKLARVEDAFTSEDGLVRKVKLAIATQVLTSEDEELMLFITSSDQSISCFLSRKVTGNSPTRSHVNA